MERVFPDGAADERVVLTGFLDWQRATVRRKAEGLPAELARRSFLETSPRMTVGVVSHLRATECGWFSGSFPSLTASLGEGGAEDGGWHPDGRDVAELLTAYEVECEHSRRVVAQLRMDDMQEFTPAQFTPVSVRWILTHMIEETARHLGHLDILREQLDGARGY